MKNNLTKKSFFIKIFIAVFLFFSLFSFSFAQTEPTGPRDYEVIAPLPGIGAENGRTNLSTYLPAAFNLTVGIAVALAFIFITLGGVLYATSDALSGKQQGREYIENAVLGLLLVIGSYVILNTINPQILSFNILIERPTVEPTDSPVIPVIPPTGCPGGCVPFAGSGLPALRASHSGVSAGMMQNLQNFHALMGEGTWYITEGGYNQTVQHQSGCHSNGTCIDGNPIDRSPSGLNNFYEKARQSNMYPVFEVATFEECRNLISTVNIDGRTPRRNPDGTPFVPYRGPIRVIGPDPQTGRPRITAPHFSVYNYQVNAPNSCT